MSRQPSCSAWSNAWKRLKRSALPTGRHWPAFTQQHVGSLLVGGYNYDAWNLRRFQLFAVDAGSDHISIVDVNDSRLSLVGVCTSGGAGPVSLTYRDGLLYVLNAANASTAAANVAGFRVDATGQLHPIAGATRPPSTAHPNPAQVQLDPQAASYSSLKREPA